ncbi:hypothetical protein [Salipiger mucosus]|uniref:Putative sulfonate/nitrate transport system substrate-binding protein n=1 Tax=Salipiger mucosus DSM 16094 TaxID=1123237 RepID=S9QX21_9RHOB|nr:hypothetical protein [Salipiger mucosus]EPX84097.1 putative sulfonate/nitrate transport system substrate-binding protein [Salipiger mucosus DSM 16094]
MRLFALLLIIGLPARAEEIVLSGPPTWETAPLIALAEDQPLADRGVTFTFRPWTSPEDLRTRLMDEASLVAVAPSLTAALWEARGIDLRVWSATSAEGALWIVGRGPAVENPSDLAGRSLALPFKGNLPDLLMQRLASDAPDAFTPTYTGNYMATMQLVLAGRAEIALLPEPLASVLVAQAPDMARLADVCELWRGQTTLEACPPGGAVVSNIPADRPDLQAAYEAAFARLAAAPQQAAALLASVFPDLPDTGEGYAEMAPRALSLPENRTVLAAFYAEIFSIAPEALGGELPDAAFFDPASE